MSSPSRGVWVGVLAAVLVGQARPVLGTGPVETPGVARATDPPQSVVPALHDAGNLRTAVANLGLIGSAPGSNLPWADLPSVEWPKGSGVDYLWVAGFWIGATQAGVPHVTTTAYEIEVRPAPADSMYASYEGAPGGARAPSPDADDDHDGRVDE